MGENDMAAESERRTSDEIRGRFGPHPAAVTEAEIRAVARRS
jgi:hypothetical protein